MMGISPSHGTLLPTLVTRLSIRPAMTKLWPSCSSNSVSALRVLMAGMVVPATVTASAKASVLTSGITCPWHVAVRLNHRGELQPHAKFAKLNRDGGDSAGVLLSDRKGKFSACQKTGFLAIDRDQVGLGQNLQKILCLKGFDHCAQMDLRVKEEHVEQVRYRRCGRSSGTGAANRTGDG